MANKLRKRERIKKAEQNLKEWFTSEYPYVIGVKNNKEQAKYRAIIKKMACERPLWATFIEWDGNTETVFYGFKDARHAVMFRLELDNV